MVLRHGRLRLGTQLQEGAAHVVLANGGKVVGAVRAPLNTADFASFVLQAKQSGAQVLGLANAGHDFTNALKAAKEFGALATMKPAALLAFEPDINALGLETAQGLYLTTAWCWDFNDETRAFAKRFMEKIGRPPTMSQAAYYSATLTYLEAVKAAGSIDPDKIMDQLRKIEINDMFTENGTIRADGLMEHPMYVMQVKKPSESKYPWDYLHVVRKMSGEEAFGKLSDRPARWSRNRCPGPLDHEIAASRSGSAEQSDGVFVSGSLDHRPSHGFAGVTRQTVFPTSSAISSAPVLSIANPTGRPRACPSASRKPVTTSSALPFGWPPLNGTNTTL